MPGTDDINLANEFLNNEEMNETRDYLIRGRYLKNLSEQELKDAWVDRFEAWFDGHDRAEEGKMNDAASELRLRDLSFPYERIPHQMRYIRQAFAKFGFEADSTALDHKIDDFLSERRRPKH